jgi:hypothetical protein
LRGEIPVEVCGALSVGRVFGIVVAWVGTVGLGKGTPLLEIGVALLVVVELTLCAFSEFLVPPQLSALPTLVAVLEWSSDGDKVEFFEPSELLLPLPVPVLPVPFGGARIGTGTEIGTMLAGCTMASFSSEREFLELPHMSSLCRFVSTGMSG